MDELGTGRAYNRRMLRYILGQDVEPTKSQLREMEILIDKYGFGTVYEVFSTIRIVEGKALKSNVSKLYPKEG